MTNKRTKGFGIITTGGTFDKYYDPISEELNFSGSSSVEKIFRAAQINEFAVSHLFQVDSQKMLKSQVKQLIAAINDISLEKVVVIHGTSKLVDTAKEAKVQCKGKLIIFTGAMVPFNYCSVEASFNLGFALGCMRILDDGVWICMNGRIFDPNNCVKNSKLGIFEEVFS